MIEKLKKEVWKANLELERIGLVIQTWGNVSGIDRSKGLIVIKPSGVEYKNLKVSDMVVVDLKGKVVEGKKRPSSDTPTHLELYKAFQSIGGITHTHSVYATMFAQACREIPCFGTTHADTFYGSIPVTRFLSKKETDSAYEKNTGKVIVEGFKKLNPDEMPGVLVAGHAPFAWGKSAGASVKNAQTLECVAKMAFGSIQLNDKMKVLPKHIIEKHYSRKHGSGAYYGQKLFK